MTLTDLVAPNAIVPALKVNSKKQAIQELAARAAELTGQNERAILEILLQREKLGSTGVGNGVAIPHGKLPKLGRLFGLFARLERPIDFEALDGQPVDLIFLLLAPEAAAAPIISRRWRASRACCAIRRSRASCAKFATPTRSTPCWRCRRRAARRNLHQIFGEFARRYARLDSVGIVHADWPRAPGSRHWRPRLRACRSA